MKHLFALLGLLTVTAVSAQDINISRISSAVPAEGLDGNAVLIVNAPVDDLTVTCLSGHPIETFNLGPSGEGMYRYRVIIDLSDGEQLRIKRRLSFSQRGKINAVADTRRYKPDTQTEMDILVVRQPLRVETATTATSMIPEAEKSCIEFHYEKDDLCIGALSAELVPEDADISGLPKTDDDGTPIAYRRYALKKEIQPNETYCYTLTIDLSPYVRELRPAYEQAEAAGDAAEMARIEQKASVLLCPGLWVSTNETNRHTIAVDSLMPRGKRVYHIIALQSEYLSQLSNAERCYADGDYFRAYQFYKAALAASDCPTDPQTLQMLKTNMSSSAKCHNQMRMARKYFDAGERVRLHEQVLTSEVDSARIYYAACETKCREVLKINSKDDYSLSTLARIRQIRAKLTRVIYGTVVDNMRQYQAVAGVSVYGVRSGVSADAAIDPRNLLGYSAEDGSFRFDVSDAVSTLVFVHETNKNYKTPTVERIPADVHRKLLIKMRPKDVFQ